MRILSYVKSLGLVIEFDLRKKEEESIRV